MKIKVGKNYFLFLIIGISILGLCRWSYSLDDTVPNLFSQANSFYQSNKYDQAILGYEKILKAGVESGNLYYNLGNCFFKKGELAKAALNYERAKLFIPNDSDLKANYSYAQSILNIGNQEFSQNWFGSWLERIFGVFPIATIALILAILQTAIFLTLIARLFLPPRPRNWPWVMITIFSGLFILFSLTFKLKLDQRNKSAILMSKDAEARFEPLASATVYFSLSEGAKVILIDKSGSWSKIVRFDGKTGWIESQAIELVRNPN